MAVDMIIDLLFKLLDLGVEPRNMLFHVHGDVIHPGNRIGFETILLLLKEILQGLHAKRPNPQLALFERWRLQDVGFMAAQ